MRILKLAVEATKLAAGMVALRAIILAAAFVASTGYATGCWFNSLSNVRSQFCKPLQATQPATERLLINIKLPGYVAGIATQPVFGLEARSYLIIV